MDDFTWKARLEERGQLRRSQNLLIIVSISLLLGLCAWYFFIYTRTPEYALQQVQSAIKSHDKAAFHKYVNTDLLVSKAYDDLTVDLFSYDKNLTPSTKALFEKFYVLVKPTITKGMMNTFDSYIENNAWDSPASTSLLKGQQLGIDFDEFIERSQIRNVSLQKIGEIKKDGNSATASIDMREDYTQTDFTLLVQLEADDSGHWQISYIKNYQDFLKTIREPLNTDITLYVASTQKLVDDYNNFFSQQQLQFKKIAAHQTNELSNDQRQKISKFIESDIIPGIMGRDNKLKAIEVPAGAKHLHELRLATDELSIDAWQLFAKGIAEDDIASLESAESLHKQSLEMDQKVSDIIKHTAIAKSIPNIP